MRKGASLIELLISIFIAILILGVSLELVTKNIKSSKKIQTKMEILNRAELNLLSLRQDLKKAGYNFVKGKDFCNGHSEPIYWDSSNKTLGLCFVDYDKPGCVNKNFNVGDACSYLIEYKLKNNRLMRCVSERADSSESCHSLLGSGFIVTDFSVNINNSGLVKYLVNLRYKGRDYLYKGVVMNLNLGSNYD